MTSRRPTTAATGQPLLSPFADGGEIGLQPKAGLYGSRRRAKRGLDLIEDKECAMAVSDILNGLKSLARGRQHHLGRQDDCRDLPRVGTEEGLERVR